MTDLYALYAWHHSRTEGVDGGIYGTDDLVAMYRWKAELKYEVERVAAEMGLAALRIDPAAGCDSISEATFELAKLRIEAERARERHSRLRARIERDQREVEEAIAIDGKAIGYAADLAEKLPDFRREEKRARHRSARLNASLARRDTGLRRARDRQGRSNACKKRGSKRSGSSSSTSSSDPGDPDGDADPPSRSCPACGSSIAHLAKQARFCGDTCRKRFARSEAKLAADLPVQAPVAADPEETSTDDFLGGIDLEAFMSANRGVGVQLFDGQQIAAHRRSRMAVFA